MRFVIVTVFLFFGRLLSAQDNWMLEIRSNVELRTLRLTNKAEQDYKPLRGASIALYQGSALVKQVTSDGSGDFAMLVPPNGDFVMVVSYAGCNAKKFHVSTKDVPDNYDKEGWEPEFPIGGVIMARPLPGINYSALEQPMAKIFFKQKGKVFDDDGDYTDQVLERLKQIKSDEDVLISKFLEAVQAGDAALKKPDCPLAKTMYERALSLIPGEAYPIAQLVKVGECLRELQKKEQELAAKAEREKQEEAARQKAKEDRVAREREEAARVAREKEEAAAQRKAEKEKLAAEKAIQEKLAREKKEAQEREREAAEKLAREKEEAAAREREAQEKLVKEKAEAAAREQEAQEKLSREKALAEKTEKEIVEKLAAEKAAAEERQRKAQEKIAREKALQEEEEKAAAEKAQREMEREETRQREVREKLAREQAKKATKEQGAANAGQDSASESEAQKAGSSETKNKDTGLEKAAATASIQPAAASATVASDGEKKTGTSPIIAKDGISGGEGGGGVRSRKSRHSVRHVLGASQYDQAVAKADEHFRNKDYEKARAMYDKALDLKPLDAHATARLDEIKALLAGSKSPE